MSTKTITLDTPIKRGEQHIDNIALRKPMAGELRGVKLVDLLNMDVVALTTILPRISTPTLTEADVARMDPADLTQLGGEVAGFLVSRSLLPTFPSPQT